MNIDEKDTIRALQKKYQKFPLFIMIKIEAQRRGVKFTEKALKKVDLSIHQVQVRSFSREVNLQIPVAFMLRDGTSIIARAENQEKENPLVIDVDEESDKIVIKDNKDILDEIYYWEKPDYYDKFTRSGVPMWQVINARPQRLEINPYQFCDMWVYRKGCKFCEIAGTYNNSHKPMYLDLDDIEEVFSEAILQPGRYTNVFLTGGINLRGREIFDEEVEYYIRLLKILGKYFKTTRFPSQLLGGAYNKKQLERIYNETGVMSYSSNLEVLDKNIFKWICPGKAYYVGYEEWKERLFCAVDIFGKKYVNTGIVCGVEMTSPGGYASEEEGVLKTLEEAENLMKHGVDVVSCVWRVAKKSLLFDMKQPSLEYYIRIASGLYYLRKKYDLVSDMDNYRRCGNHPDTDLQRIGNGEYKYK